MIMYMISDALVATYFDTLAETYKSKPELTASERAKIVLEAVLKEVQLTEVANAKRDGRRA